MMISMKLNMHGFFVCLRRLFARIKEPQEFYNIYSHDFRQVLPRPHPCIYYLFGLDLVFLFVWFDLVFGIFVWFGFL
jgi:hypothetical protein